MPNLRLRDGQRRAAISADSSARLAGPQGPNSGPGGRPAPGTLKSRDDGPNGGAVAVGDSYATLAQARQECATALLTPEREHGRNVTTRRTEEWVGDGEVLGEFRIGQLFPCLR